MPIKTEVKVTKIPECESCGWNCECEYCPMDGKCTPADIQNVHPEFGWADGSPYCSDCRMRHWCNNDACDRFTTEEWDWCDWCEGFYCDECFSKDHSDHEEDFEP